MARFTFTPTVPLMPGAIQTACLGVDTAHPFVGNDINKAVKLSATNDQNFVVAADGDDLEGVVTAVEGTTTNNGWSFGSVQRRFNYLEAYNTAATALVVGDFVVCAAQAALGTAQSYPNVKKGNGTLFRWRVVSLGTGAGAQNTVVVIEPIHL